MDRYDIGTNPNETFITVKHTAHQIEQFAKSGATPISWDYALAGTTIVRRKSGTDGMFYGCADKDVPIGVAAMLLAPEAVSGLNEQNHMDKEIVDSLVWGAIDCLLWTETDNSDDSGGLPLENTMSRADLTIAASRRLWQECFMFANICCHAGIPLEIYEDRHSPFPFGSHGESYNHYQIGFDFILTRNRHGTGFWDRDMIPHAHLFTHIAHRFNSISAVIVNDGHGDAWEVE